MTDRVSAGSEQTSGAGGQQQCGHPVVKAWGDGTRQVSGCQQAATEEVDGRKACPEHAAEMRRWKAEAEEMFRRATRHSPQIGIGFDGDVICLCKVKVLAGQEHPFDVPHGEEAQWWDDHPDAPHRPKEVSV